jgi:coenzyme F420 hydrogenase subunit beta
VLAKRDISAVVASSLCTGCGTCVAACPHGAITMQETPGGLLLAGIDEASCSGCGLCAKVCGGDHLEPGLLDTHVDPFRGPVLDAFCGYAADPDLRLASQSGGLVTALLCHLLQAKQIDGAVVTEMPEDGSLRPRPVLATDCAAIKRASGSKYCPVPANVAFRQAFENRAERLAVVGLPCHVHGLRNGQAAIPAWQRRVALVIGLFCERTLTYGAIDHIISYGDCPRAEVATFRFKSKVRSGWPGESYVRAKDGTEHFISNRHRLVAKDAFTPARCRLCFDKMNVLSDLSFGDAWGVREEKQGYSVVLARTRRGLDALQSAASAGAICVERVDPEAVFRGQAIEQRRQLWSAYTHAWAEMARETPRCDIDNAWRGHFTPGDAKQCRIHIIQADRLAASTSPQDAVARARRQMASARLQARVRSTLMVRGIRWLLRQCFRPRLLHD